MICQVEFSDDGDFTIRLCQEASYDESLSGRLYQMDLDWDDLLSTDTKDYEVTDEQINQLF